MADYVKVSDLPRPSAEMEHSSEVERLPRVLL